VTFHDCADVADADIFVRGTGVSLPARRRVQDAIASGEVEARVLDRTDIESVAVATDTAAPVLAAEAARQALERAQSTADDVRLLLHADTYHQGQDLWPAASFIQHQTVRNDCLALELRQMSNGGIAAMQLAVSHLRAASTPGDALLTAADRFCPPGIDRWLTDPGTPYGDGGSALVLSRRGGWARVLSVATHADSELEALHRGDEPWTDSPFEHRMPVDFAAAKKAFVRDHGISFAVARTTAGQRAAVDAAFEQAGRRLEDARWFVLPHFGARRMAACFYEPFGIDPDATAWSWSRTVGHLGAADQFAGLDHLAESGRLRSGDVCALMSVGAGYSWGCAVLEIQ
jgi:3-oxoacyl-[acyl-carrier-protein] synthase-3